MLLARIQLGYEILEPLRGCNITGDGNAFAVLTQFCRGADAGITLSGSDIHTLGACL
jgi:hypothetical protein